MDTNNRHRQETEQMLKQLQASVDDLRQMLVDSIHSEKPKSHPIRLAKSKKELFVLFIWAMYNMEYFVEVKENGEEEKAKGFKNIMQRIGLALGEEFNNPDQTLYDIVERDVAREAVYEMLVSITERAKKKKDDREKKNFAMSSLKDKKDRKC